MIDIKFLRENPDVVRASQKARGEDDAIVEKALKADEVRKSSLDQFETLRAEQNLLSKSVASAKGEEKAALLESAKALAAKVKEADSKRAQAEIDAKALIMQISNVLDPQAPIGKEDDFVVIENVGKPRVFDFQPKDHVELGKLLGAIDTERGAKVAGSRSYYLTGVGAMLEFALVNFAITSANKAGFTPVIPPVLVNSAAMEGTGFLGQAAENVYHLEKDDVYLVGTSEVPLAAMHMDEVLASRESYRCVMPDTQHVFAEKPEHTEKIPAALFAFTSLIKLKCFLFAILIRLRKSISAFCNGKKTSLMQWRFLIAS
jgi:seryl-tRNA synthetase